MATYSNCPNCRNTLRANVYKCSDCKTIYCSKCKGFSIWSAPICPSCNANRYSGVGKIK